MNPTTPSRPGRRPARAPFTSSWLARNAAPLLVAAGSLAAPGCVRPAAEPLRVGISPEPAFEFAYLAERRGLFARAGVNVRILQFACLSDCRRAFERGQLDGYFATPFEVLQSHANSAREPVIVRVVDRSRGYDVVLGGPRVAGVDSLRGRRVAVEAGSVDVYLLSRALERRGMELNSIRMVDVEPWAMQEALARGEVDAAACYPPFSSAIIRSGRARSLFTSAEVPGAVVDVLAFDRATLAGRGGEVRAFLHAYDEAVAWTAGHAEEACLLMAEREGVAPQTFRASLEQGVELVAATRQAEYFGPGGMLPRIVDATARVLVLTEQAGRPVPPAEVLPAAEVH